MKKSVSLKLLIIMLSIILIASYTSVFATDSVLETGDNSQTIQVTSEDLNDANASIIPEDTNYATSAGSTTVDVDSGNNSTNNTSNTSNGINTSTAYNTVDKDENDLPQTGIEDYNIGILLIICIAASIYTYKKMKSYKNI